MSLEEQIRALCAKASTASDPVEVQKALEDLRAMLKAHRDQVRELASAHARLWEDLKPH